MSCRFKEGGRQRRGAGAGRGLRRAGGGRSGERDLDKRAVAADKEDERASQGRGWAILLECRECRHSKSFILDTNTHLSCLKKYHLEVL